VAGCSASALAGDSGKGDVRPYHAASQFARDLIADRPLPPVELLIPPYPTSGTFDVGNYSTGRFVDHVRATPLEMGITIGSIAAVGVMGWHWGDSKFHFERDCWFCREGHSGGLDKVGHMYTSYVITDLLTQRIRANAADPAGAEITGAIVAMSVMTGIEVLDGYTKKYGFSREDFAADVIGAALGVARNVVPGMREKLDFRIMYTPSSYERPGVGAEHFQLIPPYRRTRYIAAIKASGFDMLKETPLRYFELHGGFDARGYSAQEHKLGYNKREQNLYVGIGLNLNELFLAKGPVPNFSDYRSTEAGWAAANFFEKVQIPYTSVYNGRN
jgi:uncharacterized protein YfiM (DUF2279 family)